MSFGGKDEEEEEEEDINLFWFSDVRNPLKRNNFPSWWIYSEYLKCFLFPLL